MPDEELVADPRPDDVEGDDPNENEVVTGPTKEDPTDFEVSQDPEVEYDDDEEGAGDE